MVDSAVKLNVTSIFKVNYTSYLLLCCGLEIQCVRTEKSEQMCICRIKIVGKFVEELLDTVYRISDILTFLGLDYKDASLITLFFVVLGIRIPKIRSIG